jgi:methionyl-tRNA synthetase
VRREPLGSPVEWVEEESYYFRLSAYGDKLLELYEKNPDFVAPGRTAQRVASFVKGGLKDLSISRTTFDWGVPVPGNDKHVMYVWVDALTNYITAAGFPDESADTLELLAGHAHHRQGHCPVPRRLLAGLPDVAGARAAETRLRARLPVQGREDVEVDRQRGRSLRPDRRITGSTRCAISSCARCRSDRTAYSHEAIATRINADLANGLGNLAQRSLSMIAKNCDGKVPDMRCVDR